MKKTLFYLLLMAGLMSCAKEMAPAVEETPAGVPMKFNFTVSEDPATKASKTAWAENDVIYVFFKGLGEKYLKLTYNGSGWDNASGGGTLLDTDFAVLSDKTLTAVYYPVPVQVSYVNYDDDKDANYFHFENSDWPVIMNYYLSDAGKAYSVDGTTVTASLTLAKPAGVALFHIAGITEGVKNYYLSCPLVKPFTCAGVRINGSLWEQTYSEGDDMWGFADSDGAVFAGRLMTTEAADYTFTLKSPANTYTLSRSNRTLAAGKTYNFPALDDDDWTLASSNIDYVDLGLPSGTLWATVNIGAGSPEEYGDYFAWGETSAKSTFNLDNYRYYDYDNRVYTKYTGSDYHILQEEDDAAYNNWGGDCRMPTAEDWEELKNNCSLVQTRLGGVDGWQITGNGNSIFLPLGGYYVGSALTSATQGYYWSSSLYNEESATIMNPTLDQLRMSDLQRYMGALIRPVKGGNKPDPDPSVDDDYVDLGLPSGLKWATKNVGATSSEGYGDLFAWGETETKADYSWDTYKFGTESSLTKYTEPSSTLLAGDDAAQVNWGDEWSIPTDADWAELMSQCEWEKTEKNGVKGMLVTGPNGNSIFLPGSGYQNGTGILARDDAFGYYWSSTLDNQFPDLGSYVLFNYNMGSKKSESHSRYRGHSVRPVYRSIVSPEDDNTINGHEYVDMGNGLKWATMNVGADSREKYGDYFAWGETAAKSEYKSDWSNYFDTMGGTTFTKYNISSGGKKVLELEDDAANKLWGGTWRIPTDEEWTWLRENCTWTLKTTKDGYAVNGMLVTSNITGNSIFLPAAGSRYGTDLSNDGSYGYYWSSSLSVSAAGYAMAVYFYSRGEYSRRLDRYYGLSVRPVSN